MRHFNKISIEMTAFTLRQNLLYMQHHFLCNISYVVIAMSMGKSLKYTTTAVASQIQKQMFLHPHIKGTALQPQVVPNLI